MQETSRRQFLAAGAAAAAAWGLPQHARAAAAYPDKSVRVIVPFPPVAPPTWWRGWPCKSSGS